MKTRKISVTIPADLTDAETLDLLYRINKIANPPRTNTKPKRQQVNAKSLTGITATISLEVTDTEPGKTWFDTDCNGDKRSLTASGNIVYKNLQAEDAISVKGGSLGSCIVTIDVDATPRRKTFAPGTFNYFILIN